MPRARHRKVTNWARVTTLSGLKVVAVKDHRFSYDQSSADCFVEKTANLREIFETL